MNFLIVVVFLVLYAVVNAAMDYINFACGTADAFHLLKYFDRLFLLLSGFFVAKITVDQWKKLKWYWWVLIVVGFLVLLKLTIWDLVYYNLRPQLEWFHDNCHISTGIYWIDKLLGFHLP